MPYPSNNSVLSLFAGQALPAALTLNNSLANKPALFLTNGGSMRFDLFAGTFTPDDQLKVSPFADAFLYLPSLKLSVVTATVQALNAAGSNQRRSDLGSSEERYYEAVDGYQKGAVDEIYNSWLKKMDTVTGIEKRAMKNLTLGYVTQDVRLFPPVFISLAPVMLILFPFIYKIGLPRYRRRCCSCTDSVLRHPRFHFI